MHEVISPITSINVYTKYHVYTLHQNVFVIIYNYVTQNRDFSVYAAVYYCQNGSWNCKLPAKVYKKHLIIWDVLQKKNLFLVLMAAKKSTLYEEEEDGRK